ncbi:MAG: hypothetical protein PUD79_01140 [Prevotellaceae bacterium]|nr:hypothetical protein [Prevotellaceae bacterium]
MRVSKVLDFFLVEQGEISAFRADFGKNQQVKTDFLLFKICTVLKLFFYESTVAQRVRRCKRASHGSLKKEIPTYRFPRRGKWGRYKKSAATPKRRTALFKYYYEKK